jgi:hypothetical protein
LVSRVPGRAPDASQGVQQAAVFGAAGVGEAQPAGEVDRALDQRRQIREPVVRGRPLGRHEIQANGLDRGNS